jgi:hypothetical protein
MIPLFGCSLLSACEMDPGPVPDVPLPGGKDDHWGSVCLNNNGELEALGLEDGTDLGFRFVLHDEPGKGGECVDDAGHRGRNPNCLGQCGDLRGRDLSGWVLKYFTMHGIDLTGADLRGAKLTGANIVGAIFDDANMRNVDLVSAYADYASFRGALLADSFIGQNRVQFADFREARFPGAWWAITDARFADFRGADMSGPRRFWYMHSCGFGETSSCLAGARYDEETKLPFSVEDAAGYGMVEVSGPEPRMVWGGTPADGQREAAPVPALR